MATQFSQPMPDAQRPAASISGDNPTSLMKSSGKAAESAGVGTLGADSVKSVVQGGQTASEMPMKIMQAGQTPDGGPGNVASEDPTVSKPNVIGPVPEGQEKNKPGRQEPIRGQTGGRANGWVDNSWNPAFGPKPAGRK